MMVRCHCKKIETQVQELKRIAREVKLEQRKCDDHVGVDGAARSAEHTRSHCHKPLVLMCTAMGGRICVGRSVFAVRLLRRCFAHPNVGDREQHQ